MDRFDCMWTICLIGLKVYEDNMPMWTKGLIDIFTIEETISL